MSLLFFDVFFVFCMLILKLKSLLPALVKPLRINLSYVKKDN